jgi:hypothetical protein
MLELAKWIGFFIGIIIIIATWGSIINTIILPRLGSSRIIYYMWLVVLASFKFAADRLPRYESKDRLLSYQGPVSLLAMLLIWILLFVFGFALLFWPFIPGNFGAALTLSGSSIFTLGIASTPQAVPIAIEFIAAASGLIVIALQIGYLPTIYSAYNRRETLVTALASRTGSPIWGPEILARHQLSQAMTLLPSLFTSWETWISDIKESHLSYPALVGFRSPDPIQNWIVSLLAVMDAAALYVSLAPAQAPPEAVLFLRAGIMGMDKLHKLVVMTSRKTWKKSIQTDLAPQNATDNSDHLAISLPFERYMWGIGFLNEVHFPMEQTPEDAWKTFCSWRVHYEAKAYALANFAVAVPAPWSGQRQHMTHQDIYNVLVNRPRLGTPDELEEQALHIRTLRKANEKAKAK